MAIIICLEEDINIFTESQTKSSRRPWKKIIMHKFTMSNKMRYIITLGVKKLTCD